MELKVPVKQYSREQAQELLEYLLPDGAADSQITRSKIRMWPPRWLSFLASPRWVLSAEWIGEEDQG